MAVYSDETERKQVEEALKESEDKYRVIFEEGPQGILAADIETRGLLYANPAVCRMFGYSRVELELLNIKDIHPDNSLDLVMSEFESQARGEKILSHGLPCLRKDGSTFYADIAAAHTIINGRNCSLGFFTDVTDRQQAEEALHKSEEKYRNIFNNAQVGIFRTGISDGKVLECNHRFARTYGYRSREECIADFVASEHYLDPAVREKMLVSLMEKGEVNDFEACFFRKDGGEVWTRFSARVYPEEGYLEGVGYDITEEKKALEALREGVGAEA